jgi:hypothetical protein
MRFVSPEAALEQGLAAYRGSHYEIAIPALEAAAAANSVVAQFFLARIYSDSLSPHTDHPKAYQLYQRIANEHADVDPVDDRRSALVAKSFVALTGYLLNGLPEYGLRPDPVRAADFARHAATHFNDPDAQFDISKLLLKGEGVAQDTQAGLHFLSMATKRGHPGAQAFLADLYWRGKLVKRDPVLALSLITVAVENAPFGERVWIEDIHQNIFCGAPDGTRRQADGVVANWRQRFHLSAPNTDRSGLSDLGARPVRTCANGETVGGEGASAGRSDARAGTGSSAPTANGGGSALSFSYGAAGGSIPGLRDAGAMTYGPAAGPAR